MGTIDHPLYGKIKPLDHNEQPTFHIAIRKHFSCDRKLEKYKHPEDADSHIQRLKATGRDSDPTRPLEVYKCKFCGFYHVGHKPRHGHERS